MHAGDCPLVTNSEGTFCMVSGYELEGPREVCYNFESAGNRVRRQTSKTQQSKRKQNSIDRKSRTIKLIGRWRDCVRKLYPNLKPELSLALARALCQWSDLLNLCKPTHPAMRRWPMLFSATVLSHMGGKDVVDARGGVIVPACFGVCQHAIPHNMYQKKFNITCRSMSKTWSTIRKAVLDDKGILLKGKEFSFVADCA
ncbi:MAG: hypothetical protein CL678_00695 [Bdellovibrionaceae bacterium]|nr:hypothetical protein [Pseudobdellovibrionaceae bacterium]